MQNILQHNEIHRKFDFRHTCRTCGLHVEYCSTYECSCRVRKKNQLLIICEENRWWIACIFILDSLFSSLCFLKYKYGSYTLYIALSVLCVISGSWKKNHTELLDSLSFSIVAYTVYIDLYIAYWSVYCIHWSVYCIHWSVKHTYVIILPYQNFNLHDCKK